MGPLQNSKDQSEEARKEIREKIQFLGKENSFGFTDNELLEYSEKTAKEVIKNLEDTDLENVTGGVKYPNYYHRTHSTSYLHSPSDSSDGGGILEAIGMAYLIYATTPIWFAVEAIDKVSDIINKNESK